MVGNPRSLQPLVDRGNLQLGSVLFIVLDEVDTCLLNKESSKVTIKLVNIKESSDVAGTPYFADATSLQHLQ